MPLPDISRYKKLNKLSVPSAPKDLTANDLRKVSNTASSNKRPIRRKKWVDCSVNKGFSTGASTISFSTTVDFSNGLSEKPVTFSFSFIL